MTRINSVVPIPSRIRQGCSVDDPESKEVIKDKENEGADQEIETEGQEQPVEICQTEKTMRDMKNLTPQISQEEIWRCDTPETRNAESTLYLVAKYFGKFDDPQKMNLAMRILNMAMMIQARDGIVSTHAMHAMYTSEFGALEWDDFEAILDKLKSSSIHAPLRIIDEYSRMEITKIGILLSNVYQRLKAEVLAMKKYGALEDIFAMLDDVRAFYHYDQYGMDVQFVYSLANHLNELTTKIKEEGDAILNDPSLATKIEGIQKLIGEILNLNVVNGENEFTLNQKVAITGKIFTAIIELLTITTKKLKLDIRKAGDLILKSPIPQFEKDLVLRLDDMSFGDIFYSCSTCSQPTEIPSRVNEINLKKALVAFFKKKVTIEFSELPEEPPKELQELVIDPLEVQATVDLIRQEMISRAQSIGKGKDYDVMKDKDPITFLKNQRIFYMLAAQNEFSLDFGNIFLISNAPRKIESFTARTFETYDDGTTQTTED